MIPTYYSVHTAKLFRTKETSFRLKLKCPAIGGIYSTQRIKLQPIQSKNTNVTYCEYSVLSTKYFNLEMCSYCATLLTEVEIPKEGILCSELESWLSVIWLPTPYLSGNDCYRLQICPEEGDIYFIPEGTLTIHRNLCALSAEEK